MCKACATGNDKHPHNGDPYSCVKGRNELIRGMKPEEQILQLIIHERLAQSMAEYIMDLAIARKKTPLEIVEEEGLTLTS